MKIYLEWLEIPCIGIYSGLLGSNLVFWELDARQVFPLSTGFCLARLGSKDKSCMKQTNIHVIETIMQTSLKVQTILTSEYYCL
jgi:hypothetical protein